MKYYLIALLLIIMGAGAYAMFEIAYQSMAMEHDIAPSRQTYFYIFMALWFILMMVADILLLTGKNLKFKTALTALLTASVMGPVIYMLIHGR